VQPSDLRIALFSGNYNYVRDGANQALNRLVDYLLRQGAQVRVYSPTVADPAFKQIFEPYIKSPQTEEPSDKKPMGDSLPSRVKASAAARVPADATAPSASRA
jgi:Tfp pilus assembly protein FimV